MMHCTMDELLALRANEGSQWARQHLEACDTCRTDLDALYQRVAKLKALPALAPARDRWPAIRAQVVATRASRRRRWAASGLAAAAVLAGAIVFRGVAGQRAYAEELAQAKSQSASLEAELQGYDPDARVQSGRAAALAADIEDRIAVVDAQLSQLNGAPPTGPQVVRLWQDRVNLMQQLVDVHVTRASYMGL